MADDATRSEFARLAAREKAESLARQAMLAATRGDREGAWRLVGQALEADPESSLAHETSGDLLLGRKDAKSAQEAFQRAVALDPTNVSAERKLAETALTVQMAAHPELFMEENDSSLASGKASVLLSFFVPGLGQLVSGEPARGAAFLACWILGVAGALLVPDGLAGIGSLIGRRGPEFNPAIMAPLFLALAAWLAAIGEASARARVSEPIRIERPRPPVDKEF
jgi:tetratricopeptide (TPR) repeat protein